MLPTAVRVLYVNHTSQMSGAERSLLELLSALPSTVSPIVACPPGPFAAAVDELGVSRVEIRPSCLTFRIHPIRTPLALAGDARTALALRRLWRQAAADLVHANSIRAGLEVLASRTSADPPAVVHVRDCLPQGLPARLVRHVLGSRAEMVLANSAYTAANVFPGWSRADVRTVYNAVDLDRFDPMLYSRGEARDALGLGPSEPVLAVIAQITPWKAQDDAIRVLALVRRCHPHARLLLAGAVKFRGGATSAENESYEQSLRSLARRLGLADAVTFLGDRADAPRVLRAVDLVLVPSWQEPFGRTVIEAMAMATPVLATSVGGPPELITDGVEGRLLRPRAPAVWADAVVRMLDDPASLERVGAAARATAEAKFTRSAHAQAVVSAYHDVLEQRRKMPTTTVRRAGKA